MAYKWPIRVYTQNSKWGYGYVATFEGVGDGFRSPGKTKSQAILQLKRSRRRFVHKHENRLTDQHNWWRKYTTNGRSK